MNYDEKQSRKAFCQAVTKLCPLGWTPVGMWLFEKGGKTYDLSTADVSQHERIEREGLFVI